MPTYSDPVKLPGRRSYYTRVYDSKERVVTPDSQAAESSPRKERVVTRNWLSLNCANLKDAKEKVATLRTQAAMGVDRVAAQLRETTAFAEAVREWLDAKSERISAERLAGYKYRVESYWLKEFGARRLCEVTTELLDKYLKARKRGTFRPSGEAAKRVRPLSATTVNDERTHLAVFFNFCKERGWVAANPVRGVERYTEAMRDRVRTLDAADEVRLLRACREPTTIEHKGKRNVGGRRGGKRTAAKVKWFQELTPPAWLAPLVTIALRCGLRRGTLVRLRWRHFKEWKQPKGSTWEIPADLMKVKEPYHAPVPASVVAELAAWKNRLAEEAVARGENPVEVTGDDALIFGLSESAQVYRVFGSVAKRAGLPGLTFHDLRRIYLNRLRNAGVSMETAMKLTAHRDVRTVLKHYREANEAELAAAVRAIDAPATPTPVAPRGPGRQEA